MTLARSTPEVPRQKQKVSGTLLDLTVVGTRTAFGFHRFDHDGIRAVLYAGRPN